MEAFKLEKENIKTVIVPVDLNTAANTGLRVSMKGYQRVSFIVEMGDSTGATIIFTLRQHNAASGGTSKNVVVDNKYFKKAGAATVFTEVKPTSAAAVYDLSTDFAADPGTVVFEVLAEDLDVNGDFAWVSLDIGDAGAAKLGTCLAILSQGRVSPSAV
jgi:hypothetical protein